MKDRFKLRAWDNELNKYLDDDDITIGTQGQTNDVYELMAHCFDDKEFTFEQCTGMTDWKNYLIYEGDVIKLVGPNWRFVIKWDNPDARFTFDALDNVNWWELSASVPGFIAKGVEVIGNIHENPELLEK